VKRVFVPMVALAFLAAVPAAAQQPSPQPPMGGQDQSRQAGPMPGGMGGMMGPGMMGGGMPGMGCPMMNMMAGMMDLSGTGAMGMMGGAQMDPKTMARMLQLRGEMLRLIGDNLIQRGKAMEAGK
jgi:hypothetical protein